MPESSNNSTFVIVVGSILLLSLFYLFGNTPIHNDGELQTKQTVNNQEIDIESDQSSDNSSDVQSESDVGSDDSNVSASLAEMDDAVDSSLEIIRERAMGMNGPYYRRKTGGKYKHDSYRATEKPLNNIDGQFKVSDVTKNYSNKFVPLEESEGGAPIKIENNKGTEKDKYDLDGYLPQEKEKDWFETIETVNVKNSHLINIYRPIGSNTIGSTHKSPFYDIRGSDGAICPKFVVSPWLQSSIEPDRSTKSLCS